jgi:triacylglycerol esterase/lipase EstA (alpha/beta hydrolase family)
MELTVNESGLSWAGYRLERFIPTTTLGIRGLRNRYFRPGLGASLAASLAPGVASAKVVGAERIGPLTKVPVTALLRLDNARASLASGRLRGRIEIFAADHASTVTVDGQAQPLEFDPTAALAYQLDKSPFYAMQIAAFLRAGVFASAIPRDRAQDGLYMLQPYSPGKIPVVLVHGTLSSPVTWAELGNELGGDPRIRERFQIWLFLYDTGNPIGYSAGRLRAALTATVKEFDPEGKDPALQRMVVIGHSQGGLLTKLTAIDSGTRFWDRLSKKPFAEVELSPQTRALLQQSMFFTPLPFVERVVFMSTPHHGALLATGRLGAIAAWLVTLPVGLVSQVAQAATASGDEGLIAVLRRPPTAIDNMNPQNPGLRPSSTGCVPHSGALDHRGGG